MKKLSQALKQPNRRITPEEPPFSSGLIDSFNSMVLALFIADALGARIEYLNQLTAGLTTARK
jgi:hypothetical protein